MNKAELVSAIAKRADVPASTVSSVIEGLQDELVEAITRGEKVAVSGLLTVERSQRSARTGRNPQTGESIDIPAANTVKVTAGSNLKKAASSVPVDGDRAARGSPGRPCRVSDVAAEQDRGHHRRLGLALDLHGDPEVHLDAALERRRLSRASPTPAPGCPPAPGREAHLLRRRS